MYLPNPCACLTLNNLSFLSVLARCLSLIFLRCIQYRIRNNRRNMNIMAPSMPPIIAPTLTLSVVRIGIGDSVVVLASVVASVVVVVVVVVVLVVVVVISNLQNKFRSCQCDVMSAMIRLVCYKAEFMCLYVLSSVL